MGKATDQTLKEIDATRANLRSDIDALLAGLPDTAGGVVSDLAADWAPKVLGGIGALTVGVVAIKSMKSKSSAKSTLAAQRQSARIQSEELARAFGALGLKPSGGPLAPMPSQPTSSKSGGGKFGLVVMLALAAGGAAAWFAGRR